MKNRCMNSGILEASPYLGSAESKVLRKKIDNYIDKKIDDWYATVPEAAHFEKNKVDKKYYVRHLIETIWRIRLLRVVESKAIAKIAGISPKAAQIWANYEMEEMLHDNLFLADLAKQGVTPDQVSDTEPYLSTKLLSGFFNYILDHEHPIGVVAYSYLVEYANVKLEPKKLEAMKVSLGEKNIQGQVAHSHTDINDDHPGEVWQVIRHLIRGEDDIKNLYNYIDECQKVLAMYFEEIYNDILIEEPRRIAA